MADGAGDGAGALPPGQRAQDGWPVLHYGPVPRFRPERWDLRVYGATVDGTEWRWGYDEFGALPRAQVRGDLHCVTRFSVLGNLWRGVPTAEIVRLAPPAPGVRHVMVWAEYGYSANVPIEEFAAPDALLATHHDGEQLSPEHGWPVRLVMPRLYAWKGPKWVRAIEYLWADRRGFWEERGYHNAGDPWSGKRYAYQEDEE